MDLKQFYINLPTPIQNLGISVRNYFAFKKRYGGFYDQKLRELKKNKNLSLYELEEIQEEKLKKFIEFTNNNSIYYQSKWSGQYNREFNKFPIIKKQDFKDNIEDVKTISDSEGVISKTGGTTGKSLQIVFTKRDMQERFAFLDYFRSMHGYELGKTTAWFSGKEILGDKDVNKKIYWKTDYLHKIRYYSTFHINDDTSIYYIKNLVRYNPEFISGFPTSINQLALFGLKNNINYPKGKLKAIFTTSETVTTVIRSNIERFFNCKLYDQYSASEGAPFIFECSEGKLHLELQSGVFEVLDDKGRATNKGKLVVTSFTSHGTPLVRYDIGDDIELSDERCNCSNNNPLCKGILGRLDDFVYSEETGKINLVNAANAFKDIEGLLNAQIIQIDPNSITIKVISTNSKLSDKEENKLIQNWKFRLGNRMEIFIEYVDEIKKEKSGKYRLIKNYLNK